MNDLRREWNARYETGDTPWDSGVTPPEVISFLSGGRVETGARALDLGCGTGTNVVWLARHGLHVVGVEHAGNALIQARERRLTLDPAARRRIALVQGDVAHLPFAGLDASYILDIGCLHGLRPESRTSYVGGIVDNLAQGGYYHLFAFDRPDDAATNPQMPWRGMGDDEVEMLFLPGLEVEDVIRGNPDHLPCRWYLLRKMG